ncbi:ImmA/IrrE family metallo-endopeptidase [Aquibacillus sp. 3ASR75-11]|uniref:ImmA/IrrE family metallo-endopeptidase n=1 Tax=Terrihalobacillus insolitus TaxID=2950438 RepID=A0A9X4AMG2_9BACI|nr:ImmA/IrrE family metallo-endopeptidase [Terrihalobacillus insolitus]MDC3411861.1 ImmA/IrrE family metallo-endopeptidase [Terrihalobacillus insolitus]MDC3423460.1 ImmA/IrrE family metallo-endopeptidase [Terrihalobacillus insolitus]
MAKVDVNPNILKWAVIRSGKSLIIEQSFPKIVEWIHGESKPTFKQLEKLAKATSTPFGYFFLDEPPEEHLLIPHYRTVSDEKISQPSPELIDTLHTMEQRQEWMRDYLLDLGQLEKDFVGSVNVSENAIQVAKKMREKLSLDKGWASECSTWEEALRLLRKKIEDIGILVIVNGIVGNNTHRKLDVNEFRGFVLVDKYAPLIFINGADGKAAQMFTLAHELAHLWFGASAIFDLDNLLPADDAIEQACNRTAAEFLVPEKDFIEAWNDLAIYDHPFQEGARKFKVSELVIARRALDTQLISTNTFFDFLQSLREREKDKSNKSNGGNFYANQTLRIGRHFAEAVISDAKEGKLLYRDAYRLTGLSGKNFNEFANRLEPWDGL